MISTPFNLVLGIDPGVSGTMVALYAEDGTYHSEMRLNTSLSTRKHYLQVIGPQVHLALVERVHHIRGDGAQGSFTFGENFGEICAHMDLFFPDRTQYITPTAWRTRLHVPFKATKKDLLALAKKEFRGEKVNLKNCDAFLLAKVAVELVHMQSDE